MKGFTFNMTIMLMLGVIDLATAFFFDHKDAYITATIWLSAVMVVTCITDLIIDIKRRNDVE